MSETIRVLHVVGSMNMGGAENFIMNLYRNINREKVQLDFIVHKDGVFDDEIRALGGRIYKLDYINAVGPIKYRKELRKFFFEHQDYKIVHSHVDQMSGLILEEAKKFNIPIRIAHSHSTGNSNNIVIRIYKKYLQSKIKKVSTNRLACSEMAGKWLYKDFEFDVIYNAIDIEKFKFSDEKRAKVRKEFNISDDTFVLGNIGRLSYPKNHTFLIKIFNEFCKKNNNSVLMLVGDGKIKNELEDEVCKLGLEKKVIFTGTRHDTFDVLNAFDVFVFPSLYEGLGIVLIEAQVNGLKCVVSDTVPTQAKLTENVEFVSLNKSSDEWSKIIQEKCVNNYERGDFSDIIRKQGYDIRDIAQKLEQFYEKSFNN